jgi:pimeloyl-ACP methyl ester carboxylesterase
MNSAPIDRDMRVNGIDLRIAMWGELTDPGKAVLMVHGLTANSRSWTKLGPALADQGLCAIGLDLRGRGRSEKPANGYGIPFHVNDLLAVIRELGLQQPHLVGHSLGARIGIWMAALYPRSISKLVLIDAGAILPADTYVAIAPALARLDTTYESRTAYLETMLGTKKLNDSPVWRDYYDYDAEIQPDGTVRSSVPKAAIDEENAVNFFLQIEPLPPYIKAPTLIARATIGLLGGESGQVLPLSEAERMQAQIPDSRVISIDNSNHYTIVTSDDFVTATLEFLSA